MAIYSDWTDAVLNNLNIDQFGRVQTNISGDIIFFIDGYIGDMAELRNFQALL